MADVLILPGVRAARADVRCVPMDGAEKSEGDRKVTLKVAAGLLNRSPDYLRKRISEKRIPHERVNGEIVVDLDLLSAALRPRRGDQPVAGGDLQQILHLQAREMGIVERMAKERDEAIGLARGVEMTMREWFKHYGKGTGTSG